MADHSPAGRGLDRRASHVQRTAELAWARAGGAAEARGSAITARPGYMPTTPPKYAPAEPRPGQKKIAGWCGSPIPE